MGMTLNIGCKQSAKFWAVNLKEFSYLCGTKKKTHVMIMRPKCVLQLSSTCAVINELTRFEKLQTWIAPCWSVGNGDASVVR